MVRAGTVSWAKEDWAGTFYPPGLASDGHLAHYAKSFDTVEVDATYFRTPTAALCRQWREQTPDGFRFSIKMMRWVTQDQGLADPGRHLDRFLTAVKELGDKFAFAVLQFSKFGKKSAVPDVGTFIARLREFGKLVPDRTKFVVEVRNREWVGDELLAFLKEQGFVFALTEVDGMAKPAEAWGTWGRKLVTSTSAYARIFGERKKMEAMATTYDRLQLDRTAETKAWIAIFREIESAGVPVWAYFSNYFAGHAPGSVELFRKLWSS